MQLRELRLEVEDLHNSKVPEELISRSESRVKELENTLRVEERWVPPQNPVSQSRDPQLDRVLA